MEQKEIEEAVKDVKKLAEDYVAGGSTEGIIKVGLKAIKEIAEIALRSQ